MERTPSQTVGPFFHEALRWPDPGVGGTVLSGRVFDGAGEPVPDALVEAWLPAARAFTRVQTDASGAFRIAMPVPPTEAPFLEITLFARGLLKALRTRAYVAPLERVRTDPALRALASSPRLETLVATPTPGGYSWDVRLQGAGETVFFEPVP